MHAENKLTTIKEEVLHLLKLKADGLLSEGLSSADSEKLASGVEKVLHELQVHQLELEMQNDELTRVAEELDRQRTRFSNLFELAPVGYLIINNSGLIKDINQTGLHLFGLSKGMLLDKPLSGFVYAEDIRHFYAFFQKLQSSGFHQQSHLRLFKKNRQSFYAEVNGVCVETGGNDKTYYLTISDISEKKSAELLLQKAKKSLDMALDASATGIWEVDPDQMTVVLDDFSCSLFRIHPGSFNRKFDMLLQLIHPDDRKKTAWMIRHSLSMETELNIEFFTRDKSVYIAARGVVVQEGEDSKRFLGTLTDITDKKKRELETDLLEEKHRHQTMSAALKAEENERRRISEVLHDSVGQMLYALRIDLEQCAVSFDRTRLQKVHSLLDKTIEDLRNISFELAPSILNDFGIAVTLEEMARRLSGETMSLHIEVDLSEEPDLNFAQNIFRIVQELVNNGIRHGKASKIRVELYDEQDTIFVIVTDNGRGFVTGKETGIPLGTGLSSIRNRLTLYKGNMEISSDPGEGTGVTVIMYKPQ